MTVLILLIAAIVAFVVIVRLTGIQWMYLCRVSIFGGLFLGLTAVLAVTAEKSLLLGAYDVRDNLGSAASGFCLFLAIWAVCATSNLVLEAGKLRVRQRITANVARVKWLRLAFVITIAVLNWNALRYASEGNRFAVGISFWVGFYTVIATVAVGAHPLNVAITPNGASAYVANAGANSVTVLGTRPTR